MKGSGVKDYEVPWIRLRWQWRKLRRLWWKLRHDWMEISVMKAQTKVLRHILKKP